VPLSHFRQWLARNPAVVIGVGLDKVAVHRHVLALPQPSLDASGGDLLLLEGLTNIGRD